MMNLICTVYTLLHVIRTVRSSGLVYLRKIWGWFDVAYIFMNGLINCGQILYTFDENNLRIIESMLSLVIIIKLLYFMQLIDDIAPLVNIILLIARDIGWFILLLVISMFAFSMSFYLIGKNQYWHWFKEVKEPHEIAHRAAVLEA